MSLAESVRQIIEEAGQAQGFTRVKTVWLEIGQLSSVEPEAMRFCFEAAMAGSIAAQARLEIVETPGQGRCETCVRDVPIIALHEACPYCGGYQVKVTGGDAMRVKELEVE
ncbi:MAG TPA: hydrogenase maturation nickel metallochaperone HypA [Gallionella sp.]|nr:hydrogenase maturation nickel metallochaperone HypA [Gallionella sp.]